MAKAETMLGTIKTICENYGFIREDDSRLDYFFHISELRNCKIADLKPGLIVEFFGLIEDYGRNTGKRKAVDVILLDKADGK